MHLIGTLLFLILFVLLFVLFLGINLLARLVGGVRNLWRMLTGGGFGQPDNRFSRGGSNSYGQQGGYSQQGSYGQAGGYNQQGSESYGQTTGQSADQGHRPHSKGVFADDEGTYVDFEEIK